MNNEEIKKSAIKFLKYIKQNYNAYNYNLRKYEPAFKYLKLIFNEDKESLKFIEVIEKEYDFYNYDLKLLIDFLIENVDNIKYSE